MKPQIQLRPQILSQIVKPHVKEVENVEIKFRPTQYTRD